MKQLLVDYTKYNHWANDRICNLINNSDPLILDKELKSSFNTIRKTLYHIWDSETIWYKRLNGESLMFWPSETFNAAFDNFTWQFLSNSLLLHNYVKNKTYTELSADIEYKNTKGIQFKNRISNIIQHCVNHSTHHRGQIYTMLRTLEITKLTPIDFIAYIRDNSNG